MAKVESFTIFDVKKDTTCAHMSHLLCYDFTFQIIVLVMLKRRMSENRNRTRNNNDVTSLFMYAIAAPK